MSLKPIESVQLNQFLKTGSFTLGSYFVLSSTFNGEPPNTTFLYLDRVNAFLAKVSSSPGGQDGLATLDPLFADNTAPLSQFFQRNPLPGQPAFLGVGEWDRANNVQRIYGGISVGSNEIWPIDQSTYQMNDPGASIWPFGWTQSAGSLATIGQWAEGNGALGEIVWFETAGYALNACTQVRHTDGNLYRGLAQIDLTTGEAVLVDGIPTFYTGSPGALFETGQFDGSDFVLSRIQFTPDDDSLPAAPKGRLTFSSVDSLSSAGDTPGSQSRYYIKVVEWNPLNVPPAIGTPSRVHKRQLVLTRALYGVREDFGTNPNSQGLGSPGPSLSQLGDRTIRFHPHSSTFVLLNDTADGGNENERGFVRHSSQPFLDRLEPVTRLATVRAGQTNLFRTRALGDLSDPIAGELVTWTLERISTLDEALDTSGAGPTSTVANPPIDAGTLEVKLTGTPLTEGVDYSVVESTGVITWLGAQSPPATSGYTASYRHSNTPATPPLGQLLQASTLTGIDGTVETSIRYAEDPDLVGQREEITATADDGT